jgi:predicted enzyme related to lactoylglutathione lyase
MFGAALGVAFLLFNIWTFLEHYRLEHDAGFTQGTVTKTEMIKRKGGVAYTVDYHFDVSGKGYEGNGQLSRLSYLSLRPGSSIDLRYVRANPMISETTEMSHNQTSMVLAGVIGLPASLFIMFINLRPGLRSTPRPTDTMPEALSDDHPRIDLPHGVRGIAYTMYPVQDMERARKFYEEDLGLKVARDFRGEWIEYHLWDNCFAITTMIKDAVKPSSEAGGSVAFEVDDVDALVEELTKKGVRVKSHPFSTPVCRMAVVLDPEGNALALHHRKR